MASDDFINVAVPERHVTAVYRLLGNLIAAESSDGYAEETGCPHCGGSATLGVDPGGYRCGDCGLVFGRSPVGVVVDHENGCWTRTMVDRLKAEIRAPLVVAALDRIASVAPDEIRYEDLATSIGADHFQLRAELGALSKITRRLFGRKLWPMSARQGSGDSEGMMYRMPLVVASWWLGLPMESRDVPDRQGLHDTKEATPA